MNNEFQYVEKPFIELLANFGWNVVISEDDNNKFISTLTLRPSFDDVIIESHLRTAISKLNDWLEPDQVEEAIQIVKRIGLRKSLIEGNMDFLNLLIEPPAFKNNRNPNEKSRSIRLVDFENPNSPQNNFVAMNQFRVDTPSTLRDYIVPDIVLFINGIPIGVVECKYPNQIDAEAMEEGITQLKRYSNTRQDVFEREGNERLFHYNQIMISTTFDEARMGTITSDYHQYLEWKDTYPLQLNEEWSSQEKLIHGALTKENLLDLIRNFALFMDSPKGKKKVVARYHQFRAVKKIINNLLNENTPEGRSGVVWHTQGSGKSLSMVFLIRKLRTIESLKRFKVVIITDRTDLQKQLSGTAGLVEKVEIIEHTKQLISELKTDTSNLVMVMAQKFLKRVTGIGTQTHKDQLPQYEEFPILNQSEEILVLVDEAHRTQSGDFGDNIALSLPNSSRIAFTGTPLITSRVKKKTYERFGKYIDKYGIKESVADGSTLSIKYEGKTVSTRIRDKQKMDIEFEDMFEGKTKEELIAIKKKYGTKGDVLEAEKRIESISKDIVKHYFTNIFDNGFKAQVVTSSRLAAIRYKKAVDQALEGYIREYENSPNFNPDRLKGMKFLKSVVRIIWENNDTPEMIRLAKEGKLKLGEDNENFKSKFDIEKSDTGIAFLVVTDMLLTGFDAEVEQVMYVDKRMTDHTLLQAIARVNRVATGKDVGYVVDYYGITNHLKEALEDYYSQEDLQIDDAMQDVSAELPLLKYRYEQLPKIFSDHGVRNIRDYVNYKITNTNEQLLVLEHCLEVLKDVEIRADFAVKFKLFLKSMDILLSKPFSRPYIAPMKAFGHIHNRAQSRFRDDSINILGAGKKVRKLIDDYLISIGINTKIKPVDIIAEGFLDELGKHSKSSKSQASEMEHAIRRHCKVMLNTDPIYYKKISKKLNDILKKFKKNWDAQVQYMKLLREEMKEGRRAEAEGLDPIRDAPFYDMLKDVSFKGQSLTKSEEESIKKTVINIVDVISLEISKVGFWGNAHKERNLRALIDDILLYSNINTLVEKKELIVTEFMKLAKNRTEVLTK